MLSPERGISMKESKQYLIAGRFLIAMGLVCLVIGLIWLNHSMRLPAGQRVRTFADFLGEMSLLGIPAGLGFGWLTLWHSKWFLSQGR